LQAALPNKGQNIAQEENALPRVLSDEDVAGFRERLCDAAAQIFIERGRDGFNMRELAARLGVSAMTPYRYFKDKDDILAAVRARAFENFAATLEAALAQPGEPAERGAAVASAYMRYAIEKPQCYRLMFDLSQPEEGAFPDLAAASRRARATMTDHVRLMVDAGLYEGDPVLIGHVMWATLHGVAVLHLAGKLTGKPDFATLRDEAMKALYRAYRKRN
jgi:AcrR family transcriptional regulator